MGQPGASGHVGNRIVRGLADRAQDRSRGRSGRFGPTDRHVPQQPPCLDPGVVPAYSGAAVGAHAHGRCRPVKARAVETLHVSVLSRLAGRPATSGSGRRRSSDQLVVGPRVVRQVRNPAGLSKKAGAVRQSFGGFDLDARCGGLFPIAGRRIRIMRRSPARRISPQCAGSTRRCSPSTSPTSPWIRGRIPNRTRGRRNRSGSSARCRMRSPTSSTFTA